jgi:hypothetical protein
MATKSPRAFHNHWGSYATAAVLPNVAAAPVQDSALELGDQAWSIADATTYQCTSPTLGAATWTPMGGGGGGQDQILVGSGVTYTQQAVPIELTVGWLTFDGSQFATRDVKFVATFDPTITGVGNAYVRLYDLGPAAGPLGAAVQITAPLPSGYAIQRTTSGLVHLETAAFTRGVPAAGVISDTPRIYAVRLYGSSVQQDTIILGSAGFLVEA